MRQTGLAVYELDAASSRYQAIRNQLDRLKSVYGRGPMRLAPVCTVVVLPPIDTREATILWQSKQLFTPHFRGQRCTETAAGVDSRVFFSAAAVLVDGQSIRLDRCAELNPDWPMVLLPQDQAHLFAHLILGLIKRRNLRRYNLSVEDRPFVQTDGRPALFFNNAFRKPEFEQMVRAVWSWLGLAIKRGYYPDPEEAMRLLDQIEAAHRPPGQLTPPTSCLAT